MDELELKELQLFLEKHAFINDADFDVPNTLKL
jgi:hypothetical protein